MFTYNIEILREKVLKMKFSHVNFDVFEILTVYGLLLNKRICHMLCKRKRFCASFSDGFSPAREQTNVYGIFANQLEQERKSETRVEREERRVSERRLDGHGLVQQVRKALRNSKADLEISREHVAAFNGKTDFHICRAECI